MIVIYERNDFDGGGRRVGGDILNFFFFFSFIIFFPFLFSFLPVVSHIFLLFLRHLITSTKRRLCSKETTLQDGFKVISVGAGRG